MVGAVAARGRPSKPGKTCLTTATDGSATCSQQPASRPIGVSSTSVTRGSITRGRQEGPKPAARMPDDPAGRSGAHVAVAQHEDVNPPYLHPAYEITVRRAPSKRLIEVPHDWFHHSRGPVWGRVPVRPGDNDLTNKGPGRPIGQTITLSGRVLDSDGRPVPKTLIEIWQTNASGAYLDPADPGFMSLDPNFTGAGRAVTDSEGRYDFRTIKPAAYPGEVGGLFRPAHIH